MARTTAEPRLVRELEPGSIFIMADGTSSPLQVAYTLQKTETSFKIMTTGGVIYKLPYSRRVFIAPEKVEDPAIYLHNLRRAYAEKA